VRIERSRRYRLTPQKGALPLTEEQLASFAALVHDRMTETVYPTRLTSFETNVVPEPVIEVDVMAHGRAALEEINKRMGLAFDDWDLQVC
jgi:phosphoribosylformylglycinamidine synthase